MNLFFISDIVIHIKDHIPPTDLEDTHEHILKEGILGEDFLQVKHKNVYIKIKQEELVRAFKFLTLKRRVLIKDQQITFIVDDYEAAKQQILQGFKIVESSGGIVQKEGQVLMIYRLRRWDLPKGGIEEGETPEQTAVREVMEECNTVASIGAPICTTWYTFSKGKKVIIKKVTWFTMECIDDTNKKPQREEGIQKVEWINNQQLPSVLNNTYLSVRYIFKRYAEKGLDQSIG